MLKKVCIQVCVIVYCITLIKGNISTMSLSETPEEDDFSKLKGQIVGDSTSQTEIACARKCMLSPCMCQGILFNDSKPLDSRCKQVHTGQQCIPESELDEYTFYYSNEMLVFDGGNKASACWNSGYPSVYLHLDDIGSGVAMGEVPGNIQFVPGGVIGNVFYNPVVVHDNAAYMELGMYPSGSYCFPEPAICPDGVTFPCGLMYSGIPATGKDSSLQRPMVDLDLTFNGVPDGDSSWKSVEIRTLSQS